MSWTYSLFRRVAEPDIYLAVPQTSPLPPFLRGESWEFGGVAEEEDLRQRGLPDGIAAWSGWRNGFYVFHDIDERLSKRKAARLAAQGC